MAGAAAPAPPAKATHAAPAFERDTTPLPASVVPKQDAEPAQADTGGDGAGAIARMLGGLAVVLLVIYGVYWLLKTVGRSRKAGGGDGRIEVLSTTALASNRSLHLVRVGDDVLLVGASEQSVTPIARYGLDELRRGGLELEPAGPGGGEAETGLGRILDELRRRSAR